MIIDATYFFGEISIAQLSSVSQNLDRYIAKYEHRYLKHMFGGTIAQLITDNDSSVNDLINGVEYINSYGKTVQYPGLKFELQGYKFSPIANYVYFHYTRDNQTIPTASGEKTGKTENSTEASPRYKLARAWNQMVEWNFEALDYMGSNMDTYPDYSGTASEIITPVNPLF